MTPHLLPLFLTMLTHTPTHTPLAHTHTHTHTHAARACQFDAWVKPENMIAPSSLADFAKGQ